MQKFLLLGIFFFCSRLLLAISPEHIKIERLSIRDGLSKQTVQVVFQDKANHLRSGSPDGLNCWKSKEPHVVNQNPKDTFTVSNTMNNKVLEKHPPLPQNQNSSTKPSFEHGEDFIQQNVAVLHVLNDERNKLYYRLKNVDDRWIDLQRHRTIFLTNIKPGHYELELSAENSDSVQSAAPVIYTIDVKPPFWQTAWFYLILCVFLFATVLALISWKVRRQLFLENIKENAREAMRQKLAADFHDEVGHRLTKISIICQLVRKKYAHREDEIYKRMTKIIEHTNEIYAEMRGFIWELDKDKKTLTDLIVQLASFGTQLFEDTATDFEIEGVQDHFKAISLPLQWREQILRIFKESMHNALKHAGASTITLSCQEENKMLTIELRDNGVGFYVNQISHQRGLQHMKDRAKKINSKLNIDTSPGGGTVIQLVACLPK